jgi:voltage-gated potassium channel
MDLSTSGSPIKNSTKRSDRRINYALIVLTGSIALGTTGFYFIEGWSIVDCLYMTIMTVTTIGYGEIYPLSHPGKIFAIFFMIVGATTYTYVLSIAVQALVQYEIVEAFGQRRRFREMSKIQNHYIICGAGRVGSRVIREMQRAGFPFIVIETDMHKVTGLIDNGVNVISRDATLDATLIEAGVERAQGLAACLPDDADNLYVVLSARNLNKNLHIVARAVEEQAEPKLIKAGANRVVAPTIIGSHRMAQALTKPAIADFMDSITAENLELGFEQVDVDEDSIYSGKELRSTNIRSQLNIVIVAIRHPNGEMVFNPSGEARIEAGDLLIAIGHAEDLAELTKLARRRK